MMTANSNAMTGQWNQILFGLVARLIRTRNPAAVRAAAMGRGRFARLSRTKRIQPGGWSSGRAALSRTGTLVSAHGHSIADHGSDVLHRLRAETVEADGQLVAHLLVNRRGNHDAAGLGEFLQPRRDVDAVTIDVGVVDHHVSQIDADAKPHPV